MIVCAKMFWAVMLDKLSWNWTLQKNASIGVLKVILPSCTIVTVLCKGSNACSWGGDGWVWGVNVEGRLAMLKTEEELYRTSPVCDM